MTGEKKNVLFRLQNSKKKQWVHRAAKVIKRINKFVFQGFNRFYTNV